MELKCYFLIVVSYVKLYMLGAWYVLKELWQTHQSLDVVPKKNLVVIITGASSGIGFEAAKKFLKMGMIVVTGQRADATEKLKCFEMSSNSVKHICLDLSDVSSVYNFVEKFKNLNLPLHILVNNSGVMFTPYKETADNHEYQWQVNYLGQFLLSHLLLPLLKSSSTTETPARIVNVSSCVHYIGTLNFDDLEGRKFYCPLNAYFQSKLAVVMFTKLLSEKLNNQEINILANCIHPGIIPTNLFKHVYLARKFAFITKFVLKTPSQGADAIIHAALSDEVLSGGNYYENCTVTPLPSRAICLADQEKLWSLSCELLNIKSFGGGTGFIGTSLSKALKKKGYKIIIISRKPGPYRMTWSELEKSGLPPSTKAVFSLAGQNVLDPRRRWTPGFKQNVWASRVNTTKYLANAIKNAKEVPDIFISISGVGFYPSDVTKEYTEESEGGNYDFLSHLCRDWESACHLPEELGVRTVQVRSGVVLSRKGGIIQQLILPFYFGFGGPVGSGEQFMPWIHIQDLIGLFIFIMNSKDIKFVVNGVAPHIITNREFASAFGKALWRPSFFPFPTFTANLLFGPERAKILTEGQKVIPRKALDFGYKFSYDNINAAMNECGHLIYKKK